MAVPNKRGPFLLAMIVLTFSAIGVSARADEIRLKDGKKLYGVIVAYEDNMFKVKTDLDLCSSKKTKSSPLFHRRRQESRKRHPQGRKMQASILQNQRPIRSHRRRQRPHLRQMLQPRQRTPA